jgi:fumarylpyruvate hydrolase
MEVHMMVQQFRSESVKNIFCVGRNFGLHAKELGNEIPDQPMIFSKPTHAIVDAKGTISFPESLGEIHHEVEIVLWIDDTYEPGKKVEDLVGGYTIGIDFTARDVQSVLKKKGHPWDLAKGFRNSAVLAPFFACSDSKELQNIQFGIKKNNEIVQSGEPSEMIFDFQMIIDYIGTHFGLGKGDIIFTGTPAGVGPIRNGDTIQLVLNQEVVGVFKVSLT